MSMGVVSDVEGAARRFWIRSHRESVFAAYTPFVVCLASGSLELDTFRHYIAQDVYFLKAFAQAWVSDFSHFFPFFFFFVVGL